MRAEMLIAVIIAVLFLAILIFILVQLTRFLAKYEQERRDFDEDLIGLAGQIKKMQTTLAEILIEQRRITRLTVEGLDLKKAEMTGDFEIIEEPLPGTGAASPQPPEPPPFTAPQRQGGPRFPELMK